MNHVTPVSFPPDVSPKILANEFGKFFEQKIENIHQTLDVLSVRPSDSDPNDVVLAAHAPLTTPSAPVIKSATVMPHLTSFSSQEQVQALIAKAPIKSCPLDPIPTSVFAQLVDVLLPAITSMINLSFETG